MTGSYQTHPHMQRLWSEVGRKLAFRARTRSELAAWRPKLLRKLRELTGYDTMQRAPLKVRRTGSMDCGDYVRERVVIQTEPAVLMPMFVLRSKEVRGPAPAVICAHGHGGGGKAAVAGLRDTPELAAAVAKYNYDYGVQFARAGFHAFCPDARGAGERQEELAKVDKLGLSCAWLSRMAAPLGQTVIGMWAWDLHRLVDYIETRRDVLPGRIGCAGLSGGGMQTFWACALESRPRIRCAVVSGHYFGYKESYLDMHGNCPCCFVPHLYEYADIGDIGALIAPRPLLIETGDVDHLNGASGMDNVLPQVEVTRKAYRLLGANEALRHDIFHGPHRWHGVVAIPWMKQLLA